MCNESRPEVLDKNAAQRTLDIITADAARLYDNSASAAKAKHLASWEKHCNITAACIFEQDWRAEFVGAEADAERVYYVNKLSSDLSMFVGKLVDPSCGKRVRVRPPAAPAPAPAGGGRGRGRAGGRASGNGVKFDANFSTIDEHDMHDLVGVRKSPPHSFYYKANKCDMTSEQTAHMAEWQNAIGATSRGLC